LDELLGRFRLLVQVCWAALTNGYAAGFLKGKLYTGQLKRICLPGLNCHSCPGALGACPVGSLQAVLGAHNFRFAFYVVGVLMLLGAVLGRFVCGFLCPFGLVQDLLYRIPFFKKLRSLPGERWLKKLKYVVLAVLVIALPLLVRDEFGQGTPWFCKLICPSGTLMAGIPMMAANDQLAHMAGWNFALKTAILIVIVLSGIVVYRPFCRYLCPLGAVYGVFNPIAFYRIRVEEDKCTKCGLCARACKLQLEPYLQPNSAECIRCGDCTRSCPHAAIHMGFGGRGTKK